jgi:cobalt-zinc-cadmium efflux system outer membrane protein
MKVSTRVVASVAAGVILSGCASLAPDRGYAGARELVLDRRGTAPDAEPALDSQRQLDMPSAPIDASAAVDLAFRYSPRLREQYARLGLGRAALDDARRLPNPGFGFSRLRGDEGTKITRSLGFGLGDALLLPLRKRLADAEFDQLEQAVASDLLELATDVEAAWYSAVADAQVAAMRELVSQAAERSAELAQRFFDAGNIDRLQLERELAASATARIGAARAKAAALRSRASFASIVGLPLDAGWSLQESVPAPTRQVLEVATLLGLARDRRLDLAATEAHVTTSEQALLAVRRWRWLGSLELGFERESEGNGSRMRGPTLDMEIPIFNQGQGDRGRAEAELMRARATRDAMVLAVENDIRSGVDRLRIAYDVVEHYRDALLPRREAVVARTQERVNYMLAGVFELIAARQQEFDAYQEYLEAVRDYWIALAELRRACGGSLPAGADSGTAVLGIEAILPVVTDGGDHQHHAPDTAPRDQNGHQHHAPSPDDPHAGHHTTAEPEPGGGDHREHHENPPKHAKPDEAGETETNPHHEHGDLR